MELKEITIEEFKRNLYREYVEIFPKDERRSLKNIQKTCKQGIEKIYTMIDENNVVGFLTLEQKEEYGPYYMGYLAIFEKYRCNGLGTQAMKLLQETIIKDGLLCIDIEKTVATDRNTIRRKEFYQRLGFKEIDSEYLVYGVVYNPLIYSKNDVPKEIVDKIIFDFYAINSGKEATELHCKIIR